MPKTNIGNPAPVKIDWVKAAIFERKNAKKLEWADIALKANCHPQYLRSLAANKHTDDWSPEIRRAVCRVLGIRIRTILTVTEDDEVDLE